MKVVGAKPYSLDDFKGSLQRLTDNLKSDELVLSRFNNEIEEQINLVVKKFSNDRENVAKYVNCMKLATKQHWMPEITQEIKVPASSTLHQCINTEISKYNVLTNTRCVIPEPKTHEDIFRLSTLVIAIYEVMKNYNIHLSAIVEKLSLDRGTITEYVNCLKLIMKEQSVYDFKEEFESIISDINSFDIKVSESSILQTCLNTEMTNYREISQLLTLVFKRYEIVTNYNKHLLKYRLLTNIVNEVNRRNTKV
ncbi:unnamed protein product [Schistosoma haematobium]|nr:unnamed protein product [Schistosoma haematobium]